MSPSALLVQAGQALLDAQDYINTYDAEALDLTPDERQSLAGARFDVTQARLTVRDLQVRRALREQA